MTGVVASLRQELLDAALAYENESDHQGASPLFAGAKLRLAAKAYGRAVRSEQVEGDTTQQRSAHGHHRRYSAEVG